MLVATAGSVGLGVAAFLPWGRSGTARRNSFELVQAAERLDLLDGALAGVGALAWFLVPAAVAGVWLAAVLRRPVMAGTLASSVAALGLALAVVVRSSPVRTEPGLVWGVAAAATALAGVAWMVIERRGER